MKVQISPKELEELYRELDMLKFERERDNQLLQDEIDSLKFVNQQMNFAITQLQSTVEKKNSTITALRMELHEVYSEMVGDDLDA